MKNVSMCLECGRSVYTNDIDLCKRCHKEFGAAYMKKQEQFEEAEDETPEISDLSLEEAPQEPLAADAEQASEEMKE